MGRIILWVCAIVVALGLAGASPPQGKAGEQPRETTRPQQPADRAAALPKADDPERLYAACRQGEAKRNSDLCAQWYAADSAKEASIWSRRTGWFTGIGLIVGAITMVAAICAALFAKEAANHTADGARAAWAAEKVTRESAERQLRAYINVFDFYMTDVEVGAAPVANFTVTNGGSTPAKRVQMYAAVTFVENAAHYKMRGYERTPNRSEWGPHHEAFQDLRLPWVMTAKSLSQLAEGKKQFLIAGVIIYRDVFGRTRRFVFRAVSPSQRATADGKLRMYRLRGRST
jgi:hypothetical protein